MAALAGALTVAAGFVLLAIIFFFFRRPDPHPLIHNDDIGGYIAVALTALLALGIATLLENLAGAAPWHLVLGALAIAASLALAVIVALGMRRARAAVTATLPPAAPQVRRDPQRGPDRGPSRGPNRGSGAPRRRKAA